MTGPVGDDAFRSYDAAYVLGALSPAERHEYEQHLVGCRRCREAVRSFAGLPGLLSRVRPEDFTTDEVQPPPDLLPALLSAATRRRRRGRWFVAAGGAVAAVICLILVLVLGLGTTSSTVNPPARQMTSVSTVPIHATVALHNQPWGTDVTLRCRYDGTISYSEGYSLVVVDNDGKSDKISSWAAVPATTAVLTGTTWVHRDQIRTVEVQTSTGTTVLTLKL